MPHPASVPASEQPSATEFITPLLPLATFLFFRKKAKLLRIEWDRFRRRTVFIFDCSPEQGMNLELEFQSSEDCKLFGVRDSLLDRSVRAMRAAEADRGQNK
jgi:hypothetical protein